MTFFKYAILWILFIGILFIWGYNMKNNKNNKK